MYNFLDEIADLDNKFFDDKIAYCTNMKKD